MLIGTAGHIDHGKTTLVKALTGVDADRLPEEKQRGITVDLGYAYTPLDDGTMLGFIDVPGHEKLVHNMLAGVTSIDFVLLIVAADDGLMPQTLEHLELVDLLGIQQGAVALTKIDRVSSERLQQVKQQILELLSASGLANSPIFEVSAIQNIGICELRDYLQHQAHARSLPSAQGRFRMAIDRAFTLKGIGTVVTGTALSGQIRLEDSLVISPPGFQARVRGLHVQDRKADSGQAGQRCAVALKGDFEKSDIHRGMWLTDTQLAMTLTRFQAWLRVPAGQGAVKHLQSVHVHIGTDDIVGRISLLDCKKVEPGDTALAEIQLDRQTLALNGDRFILRDAGAQRTVGGGRVLDIFPPRRYKRTPQRLEWLTIAAQQDSQALLKWMSRDSKLGIDLQQFALSWNLESDQVKQFCHELGLKLIDDQKSLYALSNQAWLDLQTEIESRLAAEHERVPDMTGVETERLRRMISPQLPQALFTALCDHLMLAGRLNKTRAWLHLPSHKAELSDEDRSLFNQLKPLLDASPYNPPRVRDVARQVSIPEYEVRKLFKRLSRVGELYPLARDHYFTAQTVAELAELIRELSLSEQGARIATLRDRLFSEGGGGRKVAQQILEFFDRVGYTRRMRDEHRLRHQETDYAWSSH